MANNDGSIVTRGKTKKKSVVIGFPRDGWKKKLQVNDNGAIMRNAHNVVTILSEDPQLVGVFGYDTFRNEYALINRPPWIKDFTGPRPISDFDDSGLRIYLDTEYGIRGRDLIDDCLKQVARHNAFHPVREYLNSLAWDGCPRLDRMLIEYLGADDTEYTRNVTRKAFVAAVARVMNPGCKYDTLLILVGPQGVGKSTIFRLMGRNWFLDSLQHTNDKDAFQTIQGSWIVEFAELSVLKKSEIENFKSYATSTVDKFRPSYGKRVEERPRQCVFYGTTNEDTFLRDTTGNRRFWPVRVTRQMTPEEIKEFESLVDQFWAEAKMHYEQGETLFLNTEQEQGAESTREQFVDESPLKGMIEEFLEIRLPETWKTKTIKERVEYVQDDTYIHENRGTVVRNRISAIEVFCEYIGKPRSEFTTAKGREIKNILKTLKGWKFIGQQRVGAEYGRQETFERIGAGSLQIAAESQRKEYEL